MSARKPTGSTRTYLQLCERVASVNDLPISKTRAIIDDVWDYIQVGLLAGDDVATPLGKFKRADRKARMGRNPSTGESIKIGAKNAAKFTPGAVLKKSLE